MTDCDDAEDRVKFFRRELLDWWEKEGRTFPWRETRDPYHVLIAELMLRRTRAEQVVPVFADFLRRYPTVSSLAEADPDAIASVLYPLGLAWRVAAFRAAAIAIVEDHGGIIPRNRDELLTLPGVGDYVADAILAFAFGIPAAVIDTNTVRVVGRYQGFSIKGEARRRRKVINQIRLLLEGERTRELNFAVLDLGAIICRPISPQCGWCPIRYHCAYAEPELAVGASRSLPAK